MSQNYQPHPALIIHANVNLSMKGSNHLQQVKLLFPSVSFFGKKLKYFLKFCDNFPQSKFHFDFYFPPNYRRPIAIQIQDFKCKFIHKVPVTLRRLTHSLHHCLSFYELMSVTHNLRLKAAKKTCLLKV